jgi:hypothetical protein
VSWERAGRVAWVAPVVAAVFVALRPVVNDAPIDGVELLFKLTFVLYAAIGALIARRQPRNAVGWLFCCIGIAYASGDTLDAYTAEPSGRPGAAAVALFESSTSATDLILPVLALLLFPTGRFLSARWRRAGVCAIAVSVAWTVFIALEPGALEPHARIRNPLGVEAVAGVLHALTSATPIVVGGLLLLAAAGVLDRVRRARGLERQQLKWLGLSVGFGAAVVALLFALSPFVDLDTGFGKVVAGSLLALVFAGPALAVAVAILRYRLYDVDVVINRALVYTALTATLGGAYLGVVLLLQLALQPVTADSGLAIAASTLAVAALFGPARARIQRAVDRRFYRRRYDAQRTLEAFSARLRDQVDLDAVSYELRAVVAETVQPAGVSLWLRRAP